MAERERLFSLALALIIKNRKEKRQRQRTLPYVLERTTYGAFHCLLDEMAEQDPRRLQKFLRMSGEMFDDLLHRVGPSIERADTSFKLSIPAEERLAVTLRYLAQGGTYFDLFTAFRIPETTLSYLIPEVCEAIYTVLKDTFLKVPESEAEWQAVQKQFLTRWQFPQLLGAMDGKHVRVKCPPNAGSMYWCYKEYHSIVLFAIVDADYRFIWYEVGAPGRYGDSTIWNRSHFKAALEGERLHAPGSLAAPGSDTEIPSLLVADSAFALSSRLMKPYSEGKCTQAERIFNYRLSRARRIVENAFGHLAQRFGIYQRAIQVHPEKAKKMILATLALHNYLRHMRDQQYLGPNAVDCERGDGHLLVPGEWRRNANACLPGLQPVPARGHLPPSGQQVRNALRDYFMGQGAVEWQNNHL